MISLNEIVILSKAIQNFTIKQNPTEVVQN